MKDLSNIFQVEAENQKEGKRERSEFRNRREHHKKTQKYHREMKSYPKSKHDKEMNKIFSKPLYETPEDIKKSRIERKAKVKALKNKMK